MSEFARQIIKRLDEIRLTESERREAIVSFQRAEQIADFLITSGRLGRGLIERASRAIALGMRFLGRRNGNLRGRLGRTRERRSGIT